MPSPARSRLVRRLLGLVAVLLLAAFVFVVLRVLPTATGYVAKNACSGVFVAGRDPAQLAAEDLAPQWYVSFTVDRDAQRVEASILGLASRTAYYRPGLGCAVAIRTNPDRLRARGFDPPRAPASAAPWPLGDGDTTRPDPPGLDRAALDAAVAAAFAEPDPAALRRTRAVVVVHDGTLVAERHADGFDPTTPHLGWSMTKSVTAVLAGQLVARGELALDAPAPVPAWQDDDRAAITLDQLLRMSSGLAFEERYGPLADATHMLFEVDDAAAVALHKPLAHPPDTVFSYSSGTTNIVSWLLRRRFAHLATYHRFPHEALFVPLGMRSAVFEADASGTLVGSSFMYATARDWARFGQLLLDDGVWQGQRLLPEGWVDYLRTPTKTSDKGDYGAHFWTNAPGKDGQRRLPHVPADAFQAAGFQGQAVLIVPSRRAVIVRLGMTHAQGAWDLDGFAAAVLAALPESP